MDEMFMQMMLAQMQQMGGMQQQQNPFMQALGAPAMFPGYNPQPQFGFPMMGGPFGQLASMFLPSAMASFMGPNFMQGPFGGGQNLYQFQAGLAFQRAQQQTLATSAQSDVNTYFQIAQGAAASAGIRWTGDQAAQVRSFIGANAPMFTGIMQAMAPDFYESLGGRRALAGAMAPGVFRAGQFMFDPGTGQFGLRPETTERLTTELFGQLYGPGADISLMKGLRGREAGTLLDEMVRRGIGGGMLTGDRATAALRQEMGRERAALPTEELRKFQDELTSRGGIGALGQMEPERIEAATRSMNVSRMTRSLQAMSGAVAAMKEIFGEMGRPGASMTEIMNGINAITQGGIGQMSPADLERTVRNAQWLGQRTGMGIQGAMNFGVAANQVLQQLNLNPVVATEMGFEVARQTLAFGALSAQGAIPNVFGQVSQQGAAVMENRLRAGALVSEQARRMGAFLTFGEQFRRGGGEIGFAPGGRAAALFEAVQQQQSTFVDPATGRQRSVMLTPGEMRQMLVEEGIGRGNVDAAMAADPRVYQEILNRYRAQDLIREVGQPEEVNRLIAGTMRGAATQIQEFRGNRAIVDAVGKHGFDAMVAAQRANPDAMANPVTATQEIAKQLKLKLQAENINIAGIDDRHFENLASNMVTRGAQWALRRGTNLPTMITMMGAQEQQRMARAIGVTQEVQVDLASRLAGTIRPGPMARIFEIMRREGENVEAGRPAMPLADMLAEAMGGVPTAEVNEALGKLTSRFEVLSRQQQTAARKRGPAAIAELGGIEAQRRAVVEDIQKLFKAHTPPSPAAQFGGPIAEFGAEVSTSVARLFSGGLRAVAAVSAGNVPVHNEAKAEQDKENTGKEKITRVVGTVTLVGFNPPHGDLELGPDVRD